MKKLPKVDNVNAPMNDRYFKFHLDLQLYLQLLYSISCTLYLKFCLPS